MKKFKKEIIILAIQLFLFYIYPIFAIRIDPMGMVLIMVFLTTVLGLVLGAISDNKWRLLYPAVIAVLFLPTVFMFYNESALVHSLWYLVVSASGLYPAALVRFIVKKLSKKS